METFTTVDVVGAIFLLIGALISMLEPSGYSFWLLNAIYSGDSVASLFPLSLSSLQSNSGLRLRYLLLSIL